MPIFHPTPRHGDGGFPHFCKIPPNFKEGIDKNQSDQGLLCFLFLQAFCEFQP